MDGKYDRRPKQTIIIGGGQAGLSVGYYLKKRGIPFTILDANARIGDAWRNRWDSLRLFTTARYTGLPGSPFPAGPTAFPTKDQMADYLESYAERFSLPVENNARVDALIKIGDRFIVTAGGRKYEAEQVVIAMSNYQNPQIPEFARELDESITQLHSYQYRNPSQLGEGGVLIVGAGNSGADIAMELAPKHQTWMSGKESGHVPFRIESFFGRYILGRVVRFVFHHVLSLGSPIGRNRRDALLHGKAPLVRVKPKDLVRAGIERVSRVVGVRDGRPLLEDGRVLDVSNVIWCTGFGPSFSWINLPVFDESGLPIHERGVTSSVPGLYFVGLHFLYALTSDTLMGIGRDAKHIADAVESQMYSPPSTKRDPQQPQQRKNGQRASSVRIGALNP
jgi:putative flavoprotein involved in K+ transport